MILFLLLVSCLGGLVSSAPHKFYDLNEAESLFEEFIIDFDKHYASDEEYDKRFEIFKKSLEHVNHLNSFDSQAVFGVTMFSDLTPEEFKQTYLGLVPEALGPFPVMNVTSSKTSAPDQFDWRKKNVVTKVKNQGQCGSCWAFSVTGNVEGQHAIKNKQLIELSESQLVDCSLGDNGCDGGWMSTTMSYLQRAGGSMSAQDYPYVPSKQNCKFNKNKIKVKVTSYQQYNFQSEDRLLEKLYEVGPISFGLDASSWQHYVNGIMQMCAAKGLNHAVLLVGYGTENGTPYWLIKNSWGTSFGENGYIRVKRNVNACNMMAPNGLFVSAVVA